MAEEIIISVSSHETRVAVVEQGLLQEIFIERFHTRGTVGNIYKGKVVRILPGMQSAFVDIGHERADGRSVRYRTRFGRYRNEPLTETNLDVIPN